MSEEPAAASRNGESLIVVGYDSWTEPVLDELERVDTSVTVVVTEEAAARRLDDRPVSVVRSADVNEAAFERAGIDRASAVLVATLDEQVNVLAVLTVMNVDESMEVVTFAGEARDVPKLEAAGADTVVSLGDVVGELFVEVALEERTVDDVIHELIDRAG